jgi:SAM-dependent methyltransferase
MKSSAERYDKIGIGYSAQRRPDHRIARHISEAIGEARSMLNVGAGTGSYEPIHVPTVAVEPSFEMIQQRRNRSNVVQGTAEALPFRDGAFDSSLAVLTIHHWSNLALGLRECARTSREKVAILTWDPESPGFWLTQEYFPELLELDRSIFPSMKQLRQCLGSINVKPVPVPADCIDGFLGAYWRRPEAYLQDAVRSGMSSFSQIPTSSDRLERLQQDLVSGIWHRTHGKLLAQESYDLGYRLVTAVLR